MLPTIQFHKEPLVELTTAAIFQQYTLKKNLGEKKRIRHSVLWKNRLIR